MPEYWVKTATLLCWTFLASLNINVHQKLAQIHYFQEIPWFSEMIPRTTLLLFRLDSCKIFKKTVFNVRITSSGIGRNNFFPKILYENFKDRWKTAMIIIRESSKYIHYSKLIFNATFRSHRYYFATTVRTRTVI